MCVCFWGVAWVVLGVRCGLLGGLFGFCFCRGCECGGLDGGGVHHLRGQP